MQVDEQRIAIIVEEVLRQLKDEPVATDVEQGQDGIFTCVDAAVKAAAAAQKELVSLPLSVRKKIIEAIREAGVANAEYFARMTVDETGLGRYEHRFRRISMPLLIPRSRRFGDNDTGWGTRSYHYQDNPLRPHRSILPTTHPTPFGSTTP